MSDEIVFDEVTFREPKKARRPDRDRRFACLAYDVPAPDDLPIFLDRAAADAIERHALSDTSVELGGILLGHECVDDETGEPFVYIARSLEAKHYENTQASFTYTHDSWEEITRERDRACPELDIVGWYHTHPDFGIFLSGHDVFIHQHYFARPLLVAYVVDPINQTRGFFRWKGEGLVQVRGYHVVAPRAERAALARTVNDLESLPNSAGASPAGLTLSPRLEAELIAMLSRPAPRAAAAADRASTSTAAIGLFGVVLGAAAMLGVGWLTGLTRQVEQQSAAIAALQTTLEQTAAAQRTALDVLVPADGNVGRRDLLVAKYDEVRRGLEAQRVQNDALALQLKAVGEERAALKARFDKADEAARANEAAAREAERLKARLENLEKEAVERQARIAQQEELLDAADAEKAGTLLTAYRRWYYAGIFGWATAFLLGLGLVAAVFRQPPPAPASAGPAPDPSADPPHRIS